MKFFLRLFMGLQVGIYRLTGGKLGGAMLGFKLLLLITKGRKSGKTYTTPLGLFQQGDDYLIVASNAGQPIHPAWYFNLKSNPQVTIQVLDKVMPATAEILSGEARTQAWRQVISSAPSYAKYEQRTTREIPLIVLHPNL